jgi:hypothetical protein
LEVEEGDVRLAENFLEQARGIAPDDAYVLTEHSYMLLRKAVTSPGATNAVDYVNEAMATLRAQITARGRQDVYPFHVLGTQAIAWARRCNLPKEEKRGFLKAALIDVEKGIRFHPNEKRLANLHRDLQKEILQLEVV